MFVTPTHQTGTIGRYLVVLLVRHLDLKLGKKIYLALLDDVVKLVHGDTKKGRTDFATTLCRAKNPHIFTMPLSIGFLDDATWCDKNKNKNKKPAVGQGGVCVVSIHVHRLMSNSQVFPPFA